MDNCHYGTIGLFRIALLMFLIMFSLPFHLKIIMPSGGFTASQGKLLLSGVIIAGCLGSLIAAAVLYGIGRIIPHDRLFIGLIDMVNIYLSNAKMYKLHSIGLKNMDIGLFLDE